MTLQPGTRLGPYEIAQRIGVGGMGEVYRATDTNLKRQVAIKVLPGALAGDAERLARFQREAEVLASLNHPNIAQIHGLERGDGTTALVMELVEGPTLADRIAEGPIPLDDALAIARQIAEALEAAHEQGIVHRDLKPANVKVRPDGTVKVLDFGLAKAMESTSAMSASQSLAPTITTPAMTQAGMILGTAAYMSPEQAKGRTVDKRSDVWAFGAVLFEMLSGQRAFEAEDVSETLAAVLMKEPDFGALPPATPDAVVAVLRRCLQKDRKRRIRDIGDVWLALDGAFGTGGPVAAHAAAVPTPSRRAPLPILAASLGTAAVVSLAWALWPAPTVLAPVTRFTQEFSIGSSVTRGVRTLVTVAPDGREFAYVTGTGLALRSLDEVDGRLIPGAEGLLAGPFFSPDGESIGYWDNASQELKRIARTGGVPIVICAATNLRSASWGGDDTILFSHEDGIVRVSAAGGTPQLLIPAGDGERLDAPQMLPGGESVLFSVTAGTGTARWDEAQIVAHSLRTGERTVVWNGGSDARYVPTGHLIYAVRDVLYAVPFDPATLAVSGVPVPVVQGVQRAALGAISSSTANYAVSRDGSLVYVSGSVGLTERRVALAGRTDGRAEPLTLPPAAYLSPRLSPDGRKLVVQTAEDQGNMLWTFDLTSDRQVQQLTLTADNHRPIWTPDGQRITFASDRDGPMSIYWMPADGSGVPERLTTAEPGTSHWPASWSPDGQTLLFNVERQLSTDWDIWALSLSDRETRSLYDSPNTVYLGGELSPDGKWLAYGAGPISTSVDIYVEPFPATGSRRRISQGGGLWPLWSRDGRRLFYRPSTGASSAISLKSVDITTAPEFTFSNEQTLPVEGFTVVSYYRDYDITPDGDRLVLVFPESNAGGETAQSRIVFVQNWTEELKRLVPVE